MIHNCSSVLGQGGIKTRVPKEVVLTLVLTALTKYHQVLFIRMGGLEEVEVGCELCCL